MNTIDEAFEQAARKWVEAGFSTLTTHTDGQKRPRGQWMEFQDRRPNWDLVSEWLRSSSDVGIGVVLGAVSGNVEMVELEGPKELSTQRLEQVVLLAKEAGCEEILDRVLNNLCELSAGGSLHMFLRVIDGPCRSNTQLAFNGGGGQRYVVAETRGEGGFVVVAPTTGRVGHEPGTAYQLLPGADPGQVAEVSVAERDLLYAVITGALDEPIPDRLSESSAASTVAEVVTAESEAPMAPWEAWSQEVSWGEILEPRGWTHSHRDRQGREHWTRPGKSVGEGTSATTIDDGPMYVFSSSSTLPAGQGMSKFYVHAHYAHSGDLSIAARNLRDQGYGDPLAALTLNSWNPTGQQSESLTNTDVYDRAVHQSFLRLRVAEDAKRMLAAERAGRAPALTGISLSAFLDQPDIDAKYRVQGLWPSQGRVLCAAAAKSGKTTLVVGNLLPSLVDGELFLGRYEPTVAKGHVAYLNMEVGENVIRQWLRDVGIVHADQIVVANLRGRAGALSLDSEVGRQNMSNWLRDNDIEIVILDPLAPLLAALSFDENSNADVARFFAYWNETLVNGGVTEDFIVHHTGHGGQRSRGASRLLDEPDAIWTLIKDRDDDRGEDEDQFARITATRHLSAYGRDVDLPATSLAFNETNRRLLATGQLPRNARKAATEEDQKRRIVKFVTENDCANTRRISAGSGVQKGAVPRLLNDLVECDELDMVKVGNENQYCLPAPPPRAINLPNEMRNEPSPVPETRDKGTGDDQSSQVARQYPDDGDEEDVDEAYEQDSWPKLKGYAS